MASARQINILDQEPESRDRLSALPMELLLQVFSHFNKYSDWLNLVSVSQGFYRSFLPELYKETHRNHDDYPLYAAVRTGNIATLERCHEFKVNPPLDTPLNVNVWDHGPFSYVPLRIAIRAYKPTAVQWLLDHGADANQTEYATARGPWETKTPLEIAQTLRRKILTPEERQRNYDVDKMLQDILPMPPSLFMED